MKKWRVYGTVIGNKYLGEIEAKTKKEAHNRVWFDDELDMSVDLCCSCNDKCEDPEITELFIEEVGDEKVEDEKNNNN